MFYVRAGVAATSVLLLAASAALIAANLIGDIQSVGIGIAATLAMLAMIPLWTAHLGALAARRMRIAGRAAVAVGTGAAGGALGFAAFMAAPLPTTALIAGVSLVTAITTPRKRDHTLAS